MDPEHRTGAIRTLQIREVAVGDRRAIEGVAVARREFDAELAPGDPPISVDELAGELFADTIAARHRTWLATDGDEPVGYLWAEICLDDGNEHLVDIGELYVRSPWRRRRVATEVLRTVGPVLRDDEGRTSILAWTNHDVAAGWCTRLAMTKRLEERCSRMPVADVDADQQARWLAEGVDRAPGYRLVQFRERCPDELVDAYCQAHDAMLDMPVDDMEWKINRQDEALVRSREARWAGQGLAVFRSLVLGPDGDGAGVSELFVNRHRPSLGYQGDTGVAARHRGHGIGRWLKAANLRFCLHEFPDLAVVETYNAQSNPWMLDINVAMGFRPHIVWQCWQGDLAPALAALAG